jgi:hypothetical protein
MHPARFLFATLLAAFPAFGAANDCDRTCLKGMLDQYLNAVIKHDPAAAPLRLGFRQTENAVVVKLGSGAWTRVTALGKLQRRYFDPVSGQAAYFGIVEEGSNSAIVTVRVRVENRKLTEAEWYISRQNDAGMNGNNPDGTSNGNFFEPDNLLKNTPPERIVPRAQRASREELEAITNSYFDGLTTHDGSIILHHDGCRRIENGRTMTATNDCAANLAGLNVSIVAARRYPVIDEEAQAVLAFGVFLRKPGTPQRRNAFSEWFFIDGGKIRDVYAAMFFPTPDVPVPNWPPYNGNFAPPSELAPTAPAAGRGQK